MSSQKGKNRGRPVRVTARVAHARDEARLTRRNWIIFAATLAVIAVGYVLLAMGSITLAPILLVAGYCVGIPWAILAREPAPEKNKGE